MTATTPAPVEVTALEPCPFCGGRAISHRVSTGWRVSCIACDCQPRPALPPKTEAEAIAAWNTRPVQADLVEAERRAIAERGQIATLFDGEAA